MKIWVFPYEDIKYGIIEIALNFTESISSDEAKETLKRIMSYPETPES